MSADEHAAEADAGAYALVMQRRAELFGEDSDFTIDRPEDTLRSRILAGEITRLENLGLAECMRIAAENSRDFQSRKESLYTAALDVTLERWQLGWIPSVGADGGLIGIGDLATVTDANADAGLTKILGTGAEIVAGIGLSMFRDISSGAGWSTFSTLALGITQPLLRGSGELITYEPLTQAERSLVYEVRAYERYRRELAVDIADRLLSLHVRLDQLKNEEANYQNVLKIRERNQILATAGRMSGIQVDQAEQEELRSQTQLIDVQQGYRFALDSFKLFLGLPVDVELELDPTQLDELAAMGLEHAKVTPEHAVEVALEKRPDFMTTVDRVVDAERRTRVSADALRMGLDVSTTLRLDSADGKVLDYNFQATSWGIGVALDLPINRIPQRNSYRRSLISWQSSIRSAEEAHDRIVVDLREEHRAVEARRASYEIQKNSAILAARRVESTSLSMEAGRADTRDLLESQEALLSSQNSQTQALIDYTMARLTLVLDMGMLRVDENGIRAEDPSLLETSESNE